MDASDLLTNLPRLRDSAETAWQLLARGLAGDRQGIDDLLSTYTDPAELRMIAVHLVQHATAQTATIADLHAAL